MFELWGIRRDYFQHEIGGSFEPEDTRELVATFSTEALALAYVKSSELIKGKNTFFCIQRGRYRYRKDSLLRDYDDYQICSEGGSVPHNPVI